MKFNKFAAAGFIMAAALLGFSGCGKKSDSDLFVPVDAVSTDGTMPVTLPTETTVITTTTEPPPPPDITVNMLAVGDNLVQTYVDMAAQAQSMDGVSYNFAPLYENVKPMVQAADVAIINQETLICGDGYEITGSGLNFNSPPALGEAMVELGFDVFTMANNHVLDKGIDGLASCMDYWDGMMAKYPILTLGAYRNEEDQNRIRVQEVNGMKIAYLSYAEHLNGYEIPADSPIRVGMTDNPALMERQIKEAKQIADAVVVAAHWGAEDTNIVREDVPVLAQQLIEWGADVILGTHSHTAETMQYIQRSDGTMGFVFYSLGNFISAQTDNFNVVGEMGSFDLVKDGVTGTVSVLNVGVMPVITHYGAGFSGLKLYPYSMYTPELAAEHALPYTHAYPETAKDFGWDVVNTIINNNIPVEFQRLTWP